MVDLPTMKNASFKVGDAVVLKCDNGDSVSATVKSVHRTCLYVAWYPSYAQEHTACVLKADYATRLTPFGNNLFVAL